MYHLNMQTREVAAFSDICFHPSIRGKPCRPTPSWLPRPHNYPLLYLVYLLLRPHSSPIEAMGSSLNQSPFWGPFYKGAVL